ncbi:MAG: hypothetical protein JRD87_10660 [Deltaproteobacteria bacterium]|nr:hypothetical protein [Deltaproteobacteria bacterium]MBW2571453.1 hypothetical protein [Deltaproteobacteria bacterium]MBW2670325.1 hypothetical protein [Deltaproteobacteria bacterium]MBW2710460.1 hypothetical protein [Deltaproteobacteria bacterium]
MESTIPKSIIVPYPFRFRATLSYYEQLTEMLFLNFRTYAGSNLTGAAASLSLKTHFFRRGERFRGTTLPDMPARKNHNNLNGAGRQKADIKISSAESAKIGQDAKKKNYLDMAALIRSIQRAEGHTDCFQKGMIDCDQADCKWHPFCLEGRPVLGEDRT